MNELNILVSLSLAHALSLSHALTLSHALSLSLSFSLSLRHALSLFNFHFCLNGSRKNIILMEENERSRPFGAKLPR